MLIYRADSELAATAQRVCAIRAKLRDGLGAPGQATGLLIDLGVLEAGVVDAISPDFDTLNTITDALREASLLSGHLFHGGCDQPAAARLSTSIERLDSLPLPPAIRVGVPEGYAYYGLYLETYREAARRFYEDAQPERAVVLGIRSIGTSLSAVVAAGLERLGVSISSATVRPRGHPFDRKLRLSDEFSRWLRARRNSHFAVVDEGPGLSGSSFAAVAGALSAYGIPDARIVLFPSWEPDGSGFISEAARDRWRKHRKYVVDFKEVLPFGDLPDLSAGNWRKLVYRDEGDWPAVQPQHERRKFLAGGRLLKFAGLASYGAPVLARAEALFDAGFTPRPAGLQRGFLETEFVDGRPLAAADVNLRFLDTAARYVAHLARRFPSARPVPFTELLDMIETNIGVPPDKLEPFRNPVCDSRTTAIDGRMLPHEWLLTREGYLKTDALDHHNDHFFPGCQDAAWDLAGTCVEFDLDTQQQDYLVGQFESASGDRALSARLPFYMLAYLAYRIGYVTLAQRALAASPDAMRFAALERTYRKRLRSFQVFAPSCTLELTGLGSSRGMG